MEAIEIPVDEIWPGPNPREDLGDLTGLMGSMRCNQRPEGRQTRRPAVGSVTPHGAWPRKGVSDEQER